MAIGLTSASRRIAEERRRNLGSISTGYFRTEFLGSFRSMTWKIPLFDLSVDENEIEAVARVLRSKWISMGDLTRQFETQFARMHDAKHAIAVSNGTAALHLALKGLGIKEGDEVICPSLTFVATANAILYVGARPVFADITSKDDLTISCEGIVEKITKKTKALVVVHYGGWPCEMEGILEIAKNHGLKVIEDAAHAPLAQYQNTKVGTLGEVGCFSFFSNKNMTTAEGGMMTTNNDETAERLRLMRSHGMTAISFDRFAGHASSYDVIDLGFNYRLDDIRSSIGLTQLNKVASFNKAREELTRLYRDNLEDVRELIVPFSHHMEAGSERLGSFHIFPVLIEGNGSRRDKIKEGLAAKGVQTSVHYQPVHLFRIYREGFGYKPGDLPLTEWVGNHEITLPLYPGMTSQDITYVTDSLKECLIAET
jgi:dTDP-4-amino-4,6-dideoxygalactose transaminase